MRQFLTVLIFALGFLSSAHARLVKTVLVQLNDGTELQLNVYEENHHVTYQLSLPGIPLVNHQTMQGDDEVDDDTQEHDGVMIEELRDSVDSLPMCINFETGNQAWKEAAMKVKGTAAMGNFCRYCGFNLPELSDDGSMASGASVGPLCPGCRNPLKQSGLGWITAATSRTEDIYHGVPVTGSEILSQLARWIRDNNTHIYIHIYLHQGSVRILYGIARQVDGQQQQVIVEGAVTPAIEPDNCGFQFVSEDTTQPAISPFSLPLLTQLYGIFQFVLDEGMLARSLQMQQQRQQCLPFFISPQVAIISLPSVYMVSDQRMGNTIMIPANSSESWRLIIEIRPDGQIVVKFPKQP